MYKLKRGARTCGVYAGKVDMSTCTSSREEHGPGFAYVVGDNVGSGVYDVVGDIVGEVVG